MRKTTCECCTKDAPTNTVLKVDDKLYCEACLKATFGEEEDLRGRIGETELDPTVCAYCEKDFGDKVLPKLSQYPICNPCHDNLQKRILPVWVKAFFAGILVLVVFSFWWNWRFYEGYRSLNDANTYAAANNYKMAAQSIHQSSAAVPEVEDLKALDNYYNGLLLLEQDKSAEAYKAFANCKAQLPADFNIDFLLYTAKGSMCFDAKDYKGFMENAKKLYAIDSTHINSILSMASSYSCLYVTEGNEANKEKVHTYLQKAKAIDSSSADAKIYYNMIDYRMAEHKVVDRNQFVKQFPHGWTKP